MADVIGELLVRINAEDNASAVLAKISSQTSGLASAGAAGAKSVERFTGSMNVSKSAADGYRKKITETSSAVTAKTKALNSAKTAYDNTLKATQKNTAQLNIQKASTEALIQSKKREISLLENGSRALDKKSSAYKEQQKAIEWTKVELAGLETQHKGIVQSIGQQETALTKSTTAYKKAQTEVNAAQEAYSRYSSGLSKVEQAEKSAARAASIQNMKEAGESIDKITKPLLVAGTAGAGALTAAAKASMDYETAFTGVKKTIDGTPEQMAKVNTEIKNMSRTIPVSAVDLAHIAQIGGQLGVKANDISKFTRTIADMGVATNLAGEEGATTIARFMNVMGENIDNVDRVGSAIVHLGNNTATSEAEIATMAQRLGAYSATLGVSTAGTLAYSAAMSSLGIEAEMGGSALGRTWLGIQSACVNGGAQLEAFAKYSGKSAEEFKKQWSTDPSGAFYGLLQGLSALDKDSLVSSFGKMGIENTRDIQALMKLVGGYELLGDCLQMSSKAYQENTALTKEATTAYGTTANKIQLAKNAVADAGRKWGDTLLPMITSGAKKVGEYADKLGGATEGQKKFTVKATAATLAMGAIGKATAGTVKYVGEFKDFITKLPPQLAIAAGGAAAVYAGVKLVTGVIHEAKNYKFTWGEGLAEQGEKIAAQSAKVKELAGFSKELGDLKLTINSDESSTEQIEAAKQRVQEIADILKEKYGLDITVDNSKIDETIQKLDSAIEKKTKLEGSQTSLDISEGMLELANKKPEYEQGKATQHQVHHDFKAAEQDLENYRNAMTKITDAQNAYNAAQNENRENYLRTKDEQAYFNNELKASEKYMNECGKAFKDLGGDWANWNKDQNATYIFSLLDAIKELEDSTKEGGELWNAREHIDASMKGFENLKNNLVEGNLSLINTDKEAQGIANLEKLVKEYGASAQETAMKVAASKVGVESFNDIWQKGSNGINKAVSDYKAAAKQFGASAQEIGLGTTLIKQGFDSVEQAASSGKLADVFNGFVGEMKGQGFDNKKIIEFAKALKLIPENKHIEISASGDISLVDDVKKKVIELDGKKYTVEVDAKGNVNLLDEAGNKVTYLEGVGAVSISFDADGNIEILNEAGEKVGELDGKIIEALIKFLKDSTEPDNYTPGKKPPVTVTYHVDGTEPANYDPPDKSATVYYNVVTKGQPQTVLGTRRVGFIDAKAKGTQNFRGGLAMVNDQEGITDPRELIIDGGRAFIPQGKNVILPLSKGAKIYTAAQTKRIMRNMGIPQYAKGKDNSEAFTQAKDDWTHYTKTHAVTVTAELEKWNELAGKFKSEIKDVEDIEEELFALSVKKIKELDDISEDYIDTRAKMNDWEAYADNPIDAFNRVKAREEQAVKDGKLTEEEKNKFLKSLGKDMLNTRMENSETWIANEKKYNNMSYAEEKEALDRQLDYIKEYYRNGIISVEEYVTRTQEITRKQYDSLAEYNNKLVSDYEESADGWLKSAQAYGWDAMGDNAVDYWKRYLESQKKLFESGAYKDNWDEYNKARIAGERELYAAEVETVDGILEAQKAYIDGIEESYSKAVDDMEDKYDTQKLQEDLAEAGLKVSIYSGAVTQKGKNQLKEYDKQAKDYAHQLEVKKLQKDQAETVKNLRADYDFMEKNKIQILKNLEYRSISLDGLRQAVEADTKGMQVLMNNLLTAIKGMGNNYSNTYGDTVLNISGVGNAGISSLLDRNVRNALSG